MPRHPSGRAVRTALVLLLAMPSSGCVTLAMWDGLPAPVRNVPKKNAPKTAATGAKAASAKPAKPPEPWNAWDIAWRVALTPLTLAIDAFYPTAGWR